MKTKDEVLKNLQNYDDVEKYVDRLTECLYRHHATSWSLSINCDLTDYNRMLAQSIVYKLRELGYYAEYDKRSSPWRYFVKISVFPIIK